MKRGPRADGGSGGGGEPEPFRPGLPGGPLPAMMGKGKKKMMMHKARKGMKGKKGGRY